MSLLSSPLTSILPPSNTAYPYSPSLLELLAESLELGLEVHDGIAVGLLLGQGLALQLVVLDVRVVQLVGRVGQLLLQRGFLLLWLKDTILI